MTNDVIRQLAFTMASTYSSDIQSSSFPDEMVQFVDYAESKGCSTPTDMTKFIHVHDLHSTFPNVSIAFRMFMCLMVSNCSGERSFSTMALIKNKLRSTMTHRRLSALELLCVESDVLDRVLFTDIFEKFAITKSRKRFATLA